MFNAHFGPQAYGEYGGAAFYGPPAEGFWSSCFEVGDLYLNRLFGAVLERAGVDGASLPEIVRAWRELEGWADADDKIEASPEAVEALASVLAQITPDDLQAIGEGDSREGALQCAEQLRQFLEERLSHREPVLLERF